MNLMSPRTLSRYAAGVLALVSFATASRAEIVDSINFGDPASERAHDFAGEKSQRIDGNLGDPARQILPESDVDWKGGTLDFDLRVDPDQPNYLTVKFWGGDFGQERGRLVLYIEGKQIGQRHLGEIDMLDIMNDMPRYPGRFFYKTLPLPETITHGKDRVTLSIQSIGRIWGYGNTWDKFQQSLEQDSRGIYRAYTHTESFFEPPADEPQGEVPNVQKRQEPGPEVIGQVKQRINAEIRKQMSYGDDMRQVFIQFLTKAYHTPWTDAYQNKQVLEKIVRGIDSRYRVFQENPDIIKSDRETWNHDWFGYGPTADAVRLLSEELQPYLDEKVIGTDIPRRKGWADMFVASREWHRRHRRQYTNQSMIKDTYGIYLPNRGVAVVDPSRAWPEEQAKRYLYESIGLEPWRGSDDENGNPTYPLGDDYWQLSEKGLTKELGYVGNYGEVIDWAVAIYDATRPTPDAEGDSKIKQQLIRLAKARGAFRYPNIDADGNKTMHLETVIGWRDDSYPGGTVYDSRFSWDGSPFQAGAATLDPTLVGYAQQMLEDNQFFKAVEARNEERGFRVTVNLLKVPGDYEAIKSAPSQPTRLPMAPGQPDSAFADTDNGVVAIKHGDEILYASLYWRARYAINDLARIHHLTPTIERDATVRLETQFEDSGMVHVLRDRVVEAQTDRHERSLPDVHRAEAGQEQPIARLPEGVKDFRPGQENVYAGKGDFYRCRYGPYLIGMNCTDEKTFELTLPEDAPAEAKDVMSGEIRQLDGPLTVEPGQTIVLYFGNERSR